MEGIPMDNLAMDAIRCKAAGVSYGQWKASHPVTRPVETDEGVMEKSCAFCGERFKTKNRRRIYCCELCAQNARVAKNAATRAKGEEDGK